MRVACRLRAIRGHRSLTELAAASGVNKGTLSQIERGRMLPLDEHVPLLERAYGAPIVEWYEKSGLLAMQPDEEKAA